MRVHDSQAYRKMAVSAIKERKASLCQWFSFMQTACTDLTPGELCDTCPTALALLLHVHVCNTGSGAMTNSTFTILYSAVHVQNRPVVVLTVPSLYFSTMTFNQLKMLH